MPTDSLALAARAGTDARTTAAERAKVRALIAGRLDADILTMALGLDLPEPTPHATLTGEPHRRHYAEVRVPGRRVL